jgi:hypothetical protein
LTVTLDKAPARAYRHRYRPRASAAPGHRQVASSDIEPIGRSLLGEGWTRTDEWTETQMGGRTVRWIRWIGTGAVRVEVVFGGERQVIRLEHGERIVFGPWHVTIRGLDPRGAARIIDRWAIHCAWATEAGGVRVDTGTILRRILHGYRARSVVSGSEARLAGESWASEALQAGASEWQWLGASEMQLAGASETLLLGASELSYLGASELRYLGASELFAIGGSEAFFLGASGFLGASEERLGGAS